MATAEMTLTAAALRSMLERQGGACACCDREILPGEKIAKPADSYVVVCLPCLSKQDQE